MSSTSTAVHSVVTSHPGGHPAAVGIVSGGSGGYDVVGDSEVVGDSDDVAVAIGVGDSDVVGDVVVVVMSKVCRVENTSSGD